MITNTPAFANVQNCLFPHLTLFHPYSISY